ncbi:MAG: protein phosphatase CheZ [Sphingomonadales bacterium]
MIREDLPEKIKDLVDHLRSRDKKHVGLAEIASVTEIMIGTMEAYFRSIDTRIYRGFKELTDYLKNARLEIALLAPKDLEKVRIPRAGQELDAIVKATEGATNNIMEAAEEIMTACPGNEVVEDACMRIFEACSFQDITGQRISKVVDTLEHVENRLAQLKDLFEIEESEEDTTPPPEKMDGDVALAGPALAGEGMDQDEIDSILGGAAPGEPAQSNNGAATANSESPPSTSNSADKAATKPAPDPAGPEEPDQGASQDEIDALFD